MCTAFFLCACVPFENLSKYEHSFKVTTNNHDPGSHDLSHQLFINSRTNLGL